jgi:hypothetical protein
MATIATTKTTAKSAALTSQDRTNLSLVRRRVTSKESNGSLRTNPIRFTLLAIRVEVGRYRARRYAPPQRAAGFHGVDTRRTYVEGASLRN